jgi:alpha-tubulin suppressor-like RCC1 family protein
MIDNGAFDNKIFKEISVKGGHTCILTTDQKKYCTGYNAYGQYGDGTLDSS